MNAFAGVISPDGPALAQPPQRMFDRLCHDARQVPGNRRFPGCGLHVGWTSPRDAASTPQNPAWSASGRIAVVLAGEAFHQRAAHHGGTNAAVALANDYENIGAAALRHLNGWFSGILVDLRDQSIVLFNDRFGRGRVYVHESARGFFFATEAKSLLAVLPLLRRIDPRGLAEFFSVGCVLQNRSLFTGISLLPPASAWTFRGRAPIAKAHYFSPREWEQQPALSPADYGARLREVFGTLTRRHASGGPVALSLTGGLDSRAVMAWSGAEAGALPCYTFGGPYRDCADVLIARQLAALCRHPHTTIRIGQEFFTGFTELAARSVYLSDGTMDVSGAVEVHVNRQAREIAPVRLTGNYGSEILRSHVAFRPGTLDRSLFTPEFNALLDEAAATYRSEADCHRMTFIAFKQVPWHHHARFAIEKSQLTPRSPFLDNELVALAYQAPPELAASATPLLNLIAQGNPRFAAVGTDRALRTRHVPVISSVTRSWQEFTAKAEYAYDYGMPRWLARADRALTRLKLEQLFLGRHKFYHFRVWYRDQLREAVRAQTAAADTDGQPFCYRPGVARQLAQEHLSGRVNRTLELHKLLSVQLVERLLIRAT